MSRFRVAVHIVPRRGVLDPQGAAVAHALQSLGFGEVHDVRVGRHIVIDTQAASDAEAERAVRSMCDRLLANPVIEDYEIAGVSAGGMPTRVKCLHVHLAHALAAGPGVNPFGDQARERTEPWWTGGPCVPAASPDAGSS